MRIIMRITYLLDLAKELFLVFQQDNNTVTAKFAKAAKVGLWYNLFYIFADKSFVCSM